jgi:nitrogen fixation/metabolism regulation signal transduction histidine kinase
MIFEILLATSMSGILSNPFREIVVTMATVSAETVLLLLLLLLVVVVVVVAMVMVVVAVAASVSVPVPVAVTVAAAIAAGGLRSSVVVKALRCKPKGRWFETK